MSAKSFLVTGDQVIFLPNFAGAGLLIAPAMTTVISKSINTADFRGITLEGDEKLWIVPTCPYIFPPFITAGTVMCRIKKLSPNQIAKKIQENGRSVIVVGQEFEAEFQVILPAKHPAPPNPPHTAPGTLFPGKGIFVQAVDSKAENQG